MAAGKREGTATAFEPPQQPRTGGNRPIPARDRVVFAVGGQVLVGGQAAGGKVTLLDERGLPTGASLASGESAQVVAWRPQRVGPARYLVRSSTGVEGWLEAMNIRRPPAPETPVVRKVTLPPVKAPTGGMSARPRTKAPGRR